MAAFVALCEGFLGIDPHLDLWRYLFAVNLLKKRVRKQELSMPVGCADIHLRNNRVNEYLSMRLSTSNKGWHSHWFYVKNDAVAPLPAFIGCLIEEVREWRMWGSWIKARRKSRTISPPSKF